MTDALQASTRMASSWLVLPLPAISALLQHLLDPAGIRLQRSPPQAGKRRRLGGPAAFSRSVKPEGSKKQKLLMEQHADELRDQRRKAHLR